MLSLVTRRAWDNFGVMSFAAGYGRFVDVARRAVGLGNGSWRDSEACSQTCVSCTRTPLNVSPPCIQGKNRVRSTRQHGSVRGVPSNLCPYRDIDGSKAHFRMWDSNSR